MKEFETELYNNGINFIAGIDEVGSAIRNSSVYS